MPTIYSLFNVSRVLYGHREKLLSDSGQQIASQGVFITPQSIVTFPVASSIVSGVHILLGKIFPEHCGTNISLIIIALFVGLFIWSINISDPNAKNTPRDLYISFIIAILNSCFLAMTALGIKTSIGI